MCGNLMSLAQAREYVSKLAVAREQEVKRVRETRQNPRLDKYHQKGVVI